MVDRSADTSTGTSAEPLSFGRLARAGLKQHRRMNLAVALGIAACTAVLTGALLVGDSVRGSLRHLVLDRLGNIHSVVLADHFFRTELAAEFKQAAGAGVTASPAVLLQATLAQPETKRRASGVAVYGCEPSFWKLGSHGPAKPPGDENVVLNEPLAAELGVKVGDEVIVRLPTPSQIPADSPLGRKTETVNNRRVKVSAIIPAEGLGRFGLRPNQQLPLNAYMSLASAARQAGQSGKANALLLSTSDGRILSAADEKRVQDALAPRLADYGLQLKPARDETLALESTRMVLTDAQVNAAKASWKFEKSQPSITYLANTLAAGKRDIPYSTIAGLDFATEPPLGPWQTPGGATIAPLAADEIVLNQWAADNLQVQPGAEIRVDYFEPESTHGQTRERSVTLRLKAIAAMKGPAVDPTLTPELPGVTDQLAIADWNPPFPFNSQRVRPEDEKYWDDYRATPKAFVSLETGRKLWGSRFGNTTGLHFAVPTGTSPDQLASKFQGNPYELGFTYLPLRQTGLAAAKGSTAFSGLFLGFSSFIVISALMLVVLLSRLGIEQRGRELGILLAVGWPVRRARRLLLTEGMVLALAGAAIGVAAGIGYAWLMLAGLRSWWLAAISTPFLQLYITPQSLTIGLLCGAIVSLLAIAWTVRQVRKVPARTLLAGRAVDWTGGIKPQRGWPFRIGLGIIALALVAAGAGFLLRGEEQAGSFFSAGGLLLIGVLLLLWSIARSGKGGSLVTAGSAPLLRLASRNTARNAGRSILTIGLVAAATFLIVALSAFHQQPPDSVDRRETGTGGFQFIAESDQPLIHNLDTRAGRAELGFTRADNAMLDDAEIFGLRVEPGDDASCLNLFQTQQPQVLGLPPELIGRKSFEWAASAAGSADEKSNPWLLLRRQLGGTDGAQVPVVIDNATATYSLHLSGVGDKFTIRDEQGKPLVLEVVGMLQNSILQGSLLVSEADFVKHYPGVNGYREFLIDTHNKQTPKVEESLERTLSDFGFDVQSTQTRLAGYLAVQNTYLATFRSLGGLGLLLGTFGLAAVQMRNVFERRGELGLLRAVGFRSRRLAAMVLLENSLLLIGGLAVGIFAAVIALLPQLARGGAGVPWSSLAGTLLAVVAVGSLAGALAVRSMLRTNLLTSLRGD